MVSFTALMEQMNKDVMTHAWLVYSQDQNLDILTLQGILE